MGKQQKPFLAARIPIGLEKALEEHTALTGENKTKILINALRKYVGWSDSDDKVEPDAADRLTQLEIKVIELEKLITTQTVIKLDNKKDRKLKSKIVIEEDKNLDNKKPEVVQLDTQIQLETKNVVTSKDELKVTDKKLWTHKEFSELTGINLNTLRSKRNYKKSDVTWEGVTYQLIRPKEGWRWSPIITDNNIIDQPAESNKLS